MKHFSIILFVFITLLLGSCKVQDINSPDFTFDEEAAAIEQVMRKQEAAWSEGDLEAFMEGYWNSEKLSFGGRKGFTYGYDNVLRNYQQGYPTKEIMGKLTFNIVDIMPLSKDAAYVLGIYHLEVLDDSNPSGFFTLVFRKINGDWKIVTDHTSG